MTARRVAFARIFVAAAFVAACSDAVSPPAGIRGGPGLPMFDVAATGDQNGGLNQSGTVIGARFPTNPHRGDAIIATFFWLGSTNTNIIDSVTDFLTDANSTRVGNTYRLVEYVGAGGVSMATYVATNVQNFPDPSDPQPTAGLAVRANLSTAVTDGGILISAWSGVADVSAEHHSASGAGSTATDAAPGAITIGAGSLAYGVTMSNAVVGRNGPPQGFTNLAVQSDASIADQADYLLSASGGTADPRWTWNFSQPSTWLATVLSLTTTTTTPPPPPPPGGSGNLTATATTSGSNLDPDGYTVTVDGTTSQPIATNGGSVTFTGLASGSHTVAISGVAPNCTVSGGTSQTVSVPSGGTATASFSATCTAPASGAITLDTHIGTANQTNLNLLIKGFDNGNPRHGDAIVATFFWVSATTTNIIDSVTDVTNDANFTRVGNTYHLVRFVHSGNSSTATYVATNVQNFPDTNQTPRLAVRANLRETISDGGLELSAWSGVASDFNQAMGASSSGFGSGTTFTADPGAITIAAGTLVYGASVVSNSGVVDAAPPPEFTLVNVLSDNVFIHEANYLVSATARSVDPQWRWTFNQPSTWLATVLALNPGTAPTNQPPVAAFSSSCSALTCSFTSTSSDPDGSIASYSWTFGDGATSTAQNPSHTYAAAGSYTVTLQVTDNQGAQSTTTSKTVTVTPPNQPPTANFTFSCSALTCSFTSTSSDPDGSIASYSWTFGDGGTSTAQNPSHSYTAAGSYTVSLRVTDNQGAQSTTTSKTVTVTAPNQPPTANFTSSCNGLTCSFTSTSSDPDGSIASYSWTFGDGATSTAQNPSHTYTAAGSYTVTLQVTDNQGAQSTTTSKTVTVTPPNQPPTANFTFSCSALSCNFTSTSSDPDGSIASYSWTFGDGGTSTAQNPSHSYTAAGSYTVSLRVTDNQGAQSTTTSKTVTVTAPNQPPT